MKISSLIGAIESAKRELGDFDINQLSADYILELITAAIEEERLARDMGSDLKADESN